jgi:hypothetical protein
MLTPVAQFFVVPSVYAMEKAAPMPPTAWMTMVNQTNQL